MTLLPDSIARLLAYARGRAQRGAGSPRVDVQSSALVLSFLAMAGEEATIWIVAVGKVGTRPHLRCVADPRHREAQVRLFAWLAGHIETAFSEARAAGMFPQIVVSSHATAQHLDLLADRLRWMRPRDPAQALATEQARYDRVRRLGMLFSYHARRLPVVGQQALVVATTALQSVWTTGQQPSEDEHLGTLLTWIEPPPGIDIQTAVRQAEQRVMGVTTDPQFDNAVLMSLVRRYRAARRHGASLLKLRMRERAIRQALTPVVLDIYRATERAVHLLRAAQGPAPYLAAWRERERAEFAAFMQWLDGGGQLARRDSVKAAAFGLMTREDARDQVEASLIYEDPRARATARIEGRILAGTVDNPRQVRAHQRGWELRFDVVSTQPLIRVRVGDELTEIAQPKLRVRVIAMTRQGTHSRVVLRIARGQRAVGLPSAGTEIELTDRVVDWTRLGRERGRMKRRLAVLPATHANVPTPAPVSQGTPPSDPMADLGGFR